MKKKQSTVVRIICILAVILFLAAIVACVYIMVNKVGQVEGVECGPGQYYYTDIPNWRDYFLRDYYQSPVPTAVLIVLFFAWGFLMYKLWTWLDKKK